MPPTPDLALRPMRADDLAAVLAVQAQCYPPSLHEDAAVLLARLRAAPDTVLVACDADGPCAYLFAYPSLLGRVMPLGAAFSVPNAPDALYLHDLAVAPRAHGGGLARALVGRMLEVGLARGLALSALVSLPASRGFWEGLGYAARPGQGGAALASYPEGTVYMTRAL